MRKTATNYIDMQLTCRLTFIFWVANEFCQLESLFGTLLHRVIVIAQNDFVLRECGVVRAEIVQNLYSAHMHAH